MDWSAKMAESLKSNGYQMVAYVPDEVADRLLQLLHRDGALTMVSATREEEALAILCGGFLGGKKGVLVMQGSGLGNSINALCGLAIGYQIPFLMVISERGRLGEFNSVQVPLGRAAPRIFEALGVQAFWINHPEEIAPIVEGATKLAFGGGLPVALILSTALSGGKTWR
ncbi:MAG TPA: phosphonopyruvate decarboxylase [bacterium]|nr:phosphonopyruvate decarboxylase [bacterium]